ncbi:conserved hypothetical protein [Agrobacterium fabacearum CFBP 5771]|nr:conserved hypothetical protein [Agrobacterium fabacearum CFBP 5771]
MRRRNLCNYRSFSLNGGLTNRARVRTEKKLNPMFLGDAVTRFCMFVSGIANDDMFSLNRPAPE